MHNHHVNDERRALENPSRRLHATELNVTVSKYDYGRMLTVREDTAHNIPFFFSNHHPGWWEKSKSGGR